MTNCSMLLSMAGMPFNLWMYSQYWAVDKDDPLVIPYGNILISLIIISGTVMVGMVVRHCNEEASRIITKVKKVMHN